MIHILVVEDSRTQRHLIARWLVQKKFQVTTVRDGLEALKQIRRQPPDIVLLDVVMPHLNGFEICRFLKKHRQTQKIHVILCSAKSTQIDRYWGLKQGADVYLCKPFKSRDLLHAIHSLVPPPTAP